VATIIVGFIQILGANLLAAWPFTAAASACRRSCCSSLEEDGVVGMSVNLFVSFCFKSMYITDSFVNPSFPSLHYSIGR